MQNTEETVRHVTAVKATRSRESI